MQITLEFNRSRRSYVLQSFDILVLTEVVISVNPGCLLLISLISDRVGNGTKYPQLPTRPYCRLCFSQKKTAAQNEVALSIILY